MQPLMLSMSKWVTSSKVHILLRVVEVNHTAHVRGNFNAKVPKQNHSLHGGLWPDSSMEPGAMQGSRHAVLWGFSWVVVQVQRHAVAEGCI